MRLAPLALCIALGGCGLESYPGQSLEGRSVSGLARPVVVSFAPQDRVTARCNRLTGQSHNIACATFGSGICTVHIAPPADHRDVIFTAILFHELDHCDDGHWHQ